MPPPSSSTTSSERKRSVPSSLMADKYERYTNAVPMDSDGHVLLSPPRDTGGTDLFDAVHTESPERLRASLDDQAMRINFRAYNSNGQSAFPREGQDMSSDSTSNLLHGLHIKTDMPPPRRWGSSYSTESEGRLRHSASASSLPRRVPSIRAALHSSAGSLSPGPALTSPQITAMLDITPLPSPTMAANDPWKIVPRTRSRGSSSASRSDISSFAFTSNLSPASPPRRNKVYPSLRPSSEFASTAETRQRNNDTSDDPRHRSVSDYVPEALTIPKPRNIAVSSAGPLAELILSQANMQREEYLGATRGHITPTATEPSPPSPNDGYMDIVEPAPKRAKTDLYYASSISSNQPRTYASIKHLGQGAFSNVYLAVRQVDQVEGAEDSIDYSRASTNLAGIRIRSRRLVAVKVVEYGPAGGADAERIKVSLQREVEIMKALKHPSLVQLKAFGKSDSAQALLVMNYCPGGDLFEVASTKSDVLVPGLIQRIFAELVSAVRYLHSEYIVHRDIKLENVLLNIPVQVHDDVQDWQTLDRAVVTLTDLGLSRRFPEPPESPLLTTRCGSEDYAAPELLMGQPYDGRQTDAWALGVLLYALMEGRLPFDALPGARGDPAVLRARTPHRIARVEWAWYKYGDEDGDWEASKGRGLDGGFRCVDALLQRHTSRKSLEEVQKIAWVREGVRVDGGLRLADEETL